MCSEITSISEFDESSDSSSELSFCDLPRRRKKSKKENSSTVEVLASGVTFLLPVDSPLVRGLRSKRSKVMLPNVDPKTLARLIQHQASPETPLDIQKNECVSLLRLAIVFDLDDVFQRTRQQILATVDGQEQRMDSFGYLINRLSSGMMVDDAFLTTLDHVLSSLQDNKNPVQQITILQDKFRPVLTPLSHLYEKHVTIPSVSVKAAAVDPEKPKRSKFNPFDMLIRPKKTLMALGSAKKSQISKKSGAAGKSQTSKKPHELLEPQNSKNPVATPVENSKKHVGTSIQNSTKLKEEEATPNSKGAKTVGISNTDKIKNGQHKTLQDRNKVPEKKNPLALSVIRKIPRTKPK